MYVYRAQSLSRKSRRKYKENTKKIRIVSLVLPSFVLPSFVLPSFVFFLGPLVKGSSFAKRRRKYAVCTFFTRVEEPPFILRIFLLSPFPYLSQRYVLHNYVLNSDEGLTDRALVSLIKYVIFIFTF
jgi:hypothetical protein